MSSACFVVMNTFTLGSVSGVWSPGVRVRLVGVGVSGFGEGAPSQLALFGDASTADERDRSALGHVTDALRERFGEQAVSYGHSLRFTRGER